MDTKNPNNKLVKCNGGSYQNQMTHQNQKVVVLILLNLNQTLAG